MAGIYDSKLSARVDFPARARAVASIPSLLRVQGFLRTHAGRQDKPGICDFTLGNPHQMPQEAYVAALRDQLEPRNEGWFAYKTNGVDAQNAAAVSLQRLLEMPFEPEDIHLTTGGFTAIAMARSSQNVSQARVVHLSYSASTNLVIFVSVTRVLSGGPAKRSSSAARNPWSTIRCNGWGGANAPPGDGEKCAGASARCVIR